MNDDRRHEIRREDDRVTDWRVGTLERDVKRIDDVISALGSSTAHLALLDARADENRRRIEVLEKGQNDIKDDLGSIRISLENVKVRLTLICGGAALGGSIVAGLIVRFVG